MLREYFTSILSYLTFFPYLTRLGIIKSEFRSTQAMIDPRVLTLLGLLRPDAHETAAYPHTSHAAINIR